MTPPPAASGLSLALIMRMLLLAFVARLLLLEKPLFEAFERAFGLTRAIPIMAVAIIIAMIVMVVAAKPLAEFVNRYVSVKILALAFLVLIGVVLIADGFHLHIPRPYVYFALAFSLAVQALTLVATRKQAGA
jgi:predicted tellurium resistance membrane protein TerC